ncbi:class II aldolase/adducin family protein [Microbacterium sp. PAMC21962]|uniref:class II aldolase/adducin family protein n=1 Tax=Microbacterium sp. PAMC21962 TaxID=2861280 RepID=UPI001C62D34D|nr:class II aldolase/adducin family protein [Microbacterium sp. PAMC21962]QYF97097.1 class II aldolase/adducin family protein [Microbacterium sp. PAMC21962]
MRTDVRLDAIHDLVDANHVLVRRDILDGFGHVSVRNPEDPATFLISRSLAPGLVVEDDIQVVALDGTTTDTRPSYLERFIHAEIYRARPDVHAVVHSHSASMVPFSISRTPLRAVWHMAGFLGDATPVFEVRDTAGDGSDLLIRSAALGADLADVLGNGAVTLMRGHGFVAVGDSIPQAVARAVYADLNARAQATAIQLLGDYTALTVEEGRAASETNDGQLGRAWEIWRAEAGRTRGAAV